MFHPPTLAVSKGFESCQPILQQTRTDENIACFVAQQKPVEVLPHFYTMFFFARYTCEPRKKTLSLSIILVGYNRDPYNGLFHPHITG